MRIKLITSVGSVALILSGSVLAASPVNFGNYSIGAGNKLDQGTSCSGTTGATCSAPVSDKDFFQQEVTLGGARYFHTVVNDAAGFSDENWVQAGVTGIRDKQAISETTDSSAVVGANTQDIFNATTAINDGWGQTDSGRNTGTVAIPAYADAATARVALTQSLSQTTGTNAAAVLPATGVVYTVSAANGNIFDSSFAFSDGKGTTVAATGVTTMAAGTSLDILQHTTTQVDALGNPVGYGTAVGSTHQTFGHSERSGAYNAGGTVTLNAATSTLDVLGAGVGNTGVAGSAGGTMVIAAGSKVAQTYIGQTIDLGATLGGINSFGWGYLDNSTQVAASNTGSAAELGLSFTSTANPAAATTGLPLASFGALPTF